MLNISDRHVSRLDGLPSEKIKGRYAFNEREVVIWGIKNGYFDDEIKADDLDPDTLPPDLRDKLASAQLKEEKLKVVRAEYGPITEMQRIAFQIGDFVKNGMLSIPNRIASIIAKEDDPHRCEMLMRDEIVAVMQDTADQVEALEPEMADIAKKEK